MEDYLISMFIDNELNLGEKVEFVETVHGKNGFKELTVSLLEQEILLQDVASDTPYLPLPDRQRSFPEVFRPWVIPAVGFAAAMLLLVLIPLMQSPNIEVAQQSIDSKPHRFVVYYPETNKAELIGSFTNWCPVPMQRVGSSGYWALEIDLPTGEHRYSFLLGDGKQIADPTVTVREQDDFGGENSILNIAQRTI
jgi:hypothetical protein